MKKTSGILAFILMFVMMFSNTSFAATKFTDVNDETQYKNAIMTLTSIGLLKGYEDGTFRPIESITRAEFTVMVTRALGVDSVKVEGNSFKDTAEHYAKYNIKTAADMGIVNGFEDGTFRPDQKVTYEQAVKMVVCMLGYEANALASGGWPNGYMGVGAQLGITKDITVSGAEPATRAVIAQLFNSSLDVKIQQKTVSPSGEPTYTVTDDTLMNSKLKIEKVKGTIAGVGNTHTDPSATSSLDHEMSVISDKNEEIVFDYTTFFNSVAEAKQYLGYRVTIYYKDNGESELPTIISVDKDTTKNEVYNIISEDIESYDGTQLKYEKSNGSVVSLKLKAADISLIYNGKAVTDSDITINDTSYDIADALTEWLSPDSDNFFYGEVKLTDTGADGTVDIVSINNYKIMVASKAPTTADYKITDKLVAGNYLILEPDSTQYTYVVYKNNQEVPVTSIATNDVVLYAESIDSDHYTVYATGNPVTGTITAMDETENTIKVNDKEYKVLDSCLKNLNGKTTIKVGTKGTFYIDKFDSIAYCTLTADKASSYAYMINSYQSDDGETYYASVFAPSSSSNVKTYPMKSSIKFNGSSAQPSTAVMKLKETGPKTQLDLENKDDVYGGTADKAYANVLAQPIKVDITSNNINSIISLNSEEGVTNEDNSKLVRYKPLSKYKYVSSGNFDNEFYINSSTTILYVPGDRDDKEEYMKGSYTSLFKANESYWVEPYDVNGSKVASLLMVYGNSANAEITKDSPFAFVVQNTPATSGGNDVLQMKYYTSTQVSSTFTKYTSDDTAFKDVKPGDVIQFGTNNKGSLINRKDIFKINDIKEVLDGGTYDWSDEKFEYTFRNSNGDIEIDTTTDAPYTRAFLANVAELSQADEDNYIIFSRNGFDSEGNLEEGNIERYELPKSVKILRYNTKNDTFSNKLEGSSTSIKIEDLKDAKYNKTECSKVLVVTQKRQVTCVVVYE